MKDAFCRAFCDALEISKVPAGYAVKTAFDLEGGDALTFYLAQDSQTNKWNIEDDGATIANLDMAGVDVLDRGPRAEAFAELLADHRVVLDEEEVILRCGSFDEEDLPRASLRFMSLLLRVQDFALVTRERVTVPDTNMRSATIHRIERG